jgi:large conductance mechanosensitive channel
MSIKKDFQDFVFRGNVVDLAVGVMIGASFGKIVSAVVDDLVMPVVGPLIPGGQWREFVWEPITNMKFKLGHFAATVIDFLIVATVLFIVLVKFVGFIHKKATPPPPPPTRSCGECLETIPLAAKRCKFCTSVVAALALLLLPLQAFSQEPKFSYPKPEEAPAEVKVEKKLQAKGGVVHMGGNSEALTGTLGATGSYLIGWNRLSAEANAAYVRSRVVTAVERNMVAGIQSDELIEADQATSKLFQAKARYDRFFTTNNAAYASAQVLTDTPAGKQLVAGGQVGYSRQLYKTDRNRAVAELGYDYSYERAAAPDALGVNVNSGRLFLSEDMKLSDSSGWFVSAELLTNLNSEREPVMGFEAVHGKVEAFDDTRLNARTGITTTLWGNLSFAFSFGLRYDHAPAPRKAPSGFSFAPGFIPLADTIDTTTEATLVVTFL